MSKKPVHRVKHVPQRTCVGCREVLPKRKMVRIVRTAEEVQVDPTSKLAGRGAYLHDRRACWERALNGSLAHALKTTLTSDDRSRLEDFMNALPIDAEAAGVEPRSTGPGA
ncbi:MAG TPA: YlxR family protein [Anaerolineales bacterium]|nr:YlxR family protein [Anaerolineales bacterium]